MGSGSCVSRLGLEVISCSAKGTSFLCLEATLFFPTGSDAACGKLVPLLFLSLRAMLCVSDHDPGLPIFLKLGLTRANGWDRDAQNVKFIVKCTPP